MTDLSKGPGASTITFIRRDSGDRRRAFKLNRFYDFRSNFHAPGSKLVFSYSRKVAKAAEYDALSPHHGSSSDAVLRQY
jgi:hypothetical protein